MGNEARSGSARSDFFISYAGADAQWARWITQVLEQAGYSTVMQDWDFRPGADWVHEMHRASVECVSTVAVLSRSYLSSVHGEAEWRIAYRSDPSGELGLLIPVRIDDVDPPGLLATRVYVDLAHLDADAARLRLLAGIRRQPASNLARKIDLGDVPFPGRPAQESAPATPEPDPLLGDYLRAVATQYEDLPYISLRTGAGLSAVYVPQYVEDISVASPRGDSASFVSSPRRTVDSIIDADANVLVEGGPGAGKSSLVGHIATRLAAGGAYLPAVVRANTLHLMEGSFSERLRKAVTAELGGRLIRPLHEDFFASEKAGKRWLVLIDCLDEIISARDRARLISDLLHLATVVGSPYRILITSRPVQTESQHDWSGFTRLRLLPLTDSQIAQFAESWFMANSGSAGPGAGPGADAAPRFVTELRSRSLIELVRTPIVLTMAASVFTPDATHALPGNRSAIYEKFLDLMEVEESERRTRTAFRNSWDQRYGHRGEVMADEIFSSRRHILEALAADRQHGGAGLLLDGMTRQLMRRWAAGENAGLDAEWLAQQAAVLLIRSALVVPVGPDYQFVHETVREFLVAEGIVRNGLRPQDAEAVQLVQQWRDTAWRQVILFMLGLWSNRGEAVDPLLRVIGDDRPAGVVFAASALIDGLKVSPQDRQDIIRRLGSLVRTMSWGEVLFSDPNPFRVMVGLGDPLCSQELLAVATDSKAEPAIRAFSAEILSELAPDARALGVLADLARNSRDVMVRHGAALALARLGQLEAALPVLENVISDTSAGLLLRSRAVDALGQYEADQSLLRITTLPDVEPSLREIAAAHLESRGYGAHAAKTLTALVEDDRVSAQVRERAVLDLSRGSETHVLRDIADNESADGWIRVLAARALAGAGDQAGAIGRLRAIARDPGQDERVRLRAVQDICTLGDDEGVLSLVTSTDGFVRLAAAANAPRKDHVNELRAAARQTAADTSLEPDIRLEAAAVLQRLDANREAAKLILNMARSPSFPSHVREDAILHLSASRDAEELLTLCEDTSLPGWLRISACDALMRITPTEEIVLKPFFSQLRQLSSGWQRQRIEDLARGLPA